MHNERIEVICGPMFSGKTDELLRRLNRLKYSRTDFMLFKPKVDNRYSDISVVTHDNVSLDSISVEYAEQILEICDKQKDIKVVAIDEAQFFLKKEPQGINLVEVCQVLKENGYRVILNGLDMDFMGKPFGLMPELLAISDEVTKLKSVCLICGADATMTYRVDEKNGDLVQLGSTDKYQARCFNHWKK
jgi:thymidine kinase